MNYSGKLKNIPHILWCNLDREKDRRHRMEKHMSKLNLENTRIESIDKNNYEIHINIDPFKKGQIFCGASHLKAIKYFVDNHEVIGDYCIIMEDDIDISYSVDMWTKNFWDYFGDIYECIQMQVLIMKVKVNHFKRNESNMKEYFFDNYKNGGIKWNYFFGGGAYMLSYNKAVKIINKYNFKSDIEYVNRYQDYIYYEEMDMNRLTHADHNMSYSHHDTLTKVLFFLEDDNISYIGDDDYSFRLNENNIYMKEYIKSNNFL